MRDCLTVVLSLLGRREPLPGSLGPAPCCRDRAYLGAGRPLRRFRIGPAVAPDSRSRPRADPRARPRRWVARSKAGSAARELSPRGGREECMKGPRRARMPFYGAGPKYLDRTEKETEWLRFHAPQAPVNSHCTPTNPLICGGQRASQFPLHPYTSRQFPLPPTWAGYCSKSRFRGEAG